jgi:hypothetical protein
MGMSLMRGKDFLLINRGNTAKLVDIMGRARNYKRLDQGIRKKSV